MRELVSGHEVDSEAWSAVPVVAVPELTDESIPFDAEAESLLGELFGFTFTSEFAEYPGGDHGMVLYLVPRTGRQTLRPIATRVLIGHERALFFDYDLALLDADGVDEHVRDRFQAHGVGLYLRTAKAWRTRDGWWVAATIQRNWLTGEFHTALVAELGDHPMIRLTPEGSVSGRAR